MSLRDLKPEVNSGNQTICLLSDHGISIRYYRGPFSFPFLLSISVNTILYLHSLLSSKIKKEMQALQSRITVISGTHVIIITSVPVSAWTKCDREHCFYITSCSLIDSEIRPSLVQRESKGLFYKVSAKLILFVCPMNLV